MNITTQRVLNFLHGSLLLSCFIIVAACASEKSSSSAASKPDSQESQLRNKAATTVPDDDNWSSELSSESGIHLASVISASSLSTGCDSMKPEEVFKVLVSSSRDAAASYGAHVGNINDLGAKLAELKLANKHRRFEVEFAGETHALQAPLVLNQTSHSPECGIALRAQPNTTPILKPAGELKNWVVHRGDIVRTEVPQGSLVTGLSYNGHLLLRSRFPSRNINTPVGTILQLNELERTFLLQAHESTERLQKAIAAAPFEGDPQIWIPGTGSIYTFNIAGVRQATKGVLAVADNDQQHTVAFKCMQFKAQEILSDEERAACRSNPGNSNLAHKEVWRGIKPNHPFFLENHVEFISAPGEWAFDAQTRALYLRMPQGETLASLNAGGVNFIANLRRAIEMQNLLKVDQINHFSLEGLRFEGANFVQQEPIFAMARGAVSTAHLVWNTQKQAFEKQNLASAIEIRDVQNLVLKRNEFVAFDGVGVTIAGGSAHRVESNLFREIGFSSFEMLNVSGVVVRNNVFRNIGIRGVGDAVRVSGVQLLIANNDIRNSLRGGIQVAGTWCGESAKRCNIFVKDNFLENVIMGGLTDYGAIYLNSISHKTVPSIWNKNQVSAEVTGNQIKKVRIAGFYPASFAIEGPTGVYLDSGSKKVLVAGNILDSVFNALNQNCSDANRLARNQITKTLSLLKSFEHYSSTGEWVKKCVAIDPLWAKIEGTTQVLNNGPTAIPRPTEAGLLSEERHFWISRGVIDL